VVGGADGVSVSLAVTGRCILAFDRTATKQSV
jgi:hypothetical protein